MNIERVSRNSYKIRLRIYRWKICTSYLMTDERIMIMILFYIDDNDDDVDNDDNDCEFVFVYL